MSISQKDKEILRELGMQIAEIAADPINDKRRETLRALNAMEKGRPYISIYQEPFHELNIDGELNLYCDDKFCRNIEKQFRRTLYKWRVFPGDMIVKPVLNQSLVINDSGFGIDEDVDIEKTSKRSAVVSRHFNIQISEESDIQKIKKPIIKYDEALTEERYEKKSEIFDGILSVKKVGVGSCWFNPWDFLIRLTGIQEILMDLVLRPDYVHKLMSHLVDCWISRFDTLEEQGLLNCPASEMTVSGAAQIFSEVSPEMHGEFALQHEARFYKRFKRVHYGCCEPLHDKVDICAEYLPNMYQISMSPWVDFAKGAENVRDRFIFGWRPNPAFLAHEHWNPAMIRKDIEDSLAIAHANGCTVAIYLKDISTVANEPHRLMEWDKIAKECVEKYDIS